ncbi:MAG: RHS repeat-associated core domain-containing protein, partial [Desulfatiglans sp.]|nr:RHS repeat-associated core domain-containing protein [Desulfatiglans sp.]
SEGIGRRNITYNHTNMPVQISYKGGTPTYLTYDGEGNRIKKVQGSSTTIYVGDIFEKRGTLEVSHIYAHGKRIISRTSDGKEYYTHTDHLGSTNLVTDETGQVLEENGYLPFGGALFRNEYNGGTFKSAYRYTGQELDSEYELYNYNARLYDPVMSRFISPDTIIPDQYNPQALNRYSYCLNNPLKYTDPTGHYAGVYGPDDYNPWSSVDWQLGQSYHYYIHNPNLFGLLAGPEIFGIQQAREMNERYISNLNNLFRMAEGMDLFGMHTLNKQQYSKNYKDKCMSLLEKGKGYDAPQNTDTLIKLMNEFVADNKGVKISFDNIGNFGSMDVFTGNVTIGPAAWRSKGFLMSTIGHEVVIHFMDQYTRNNICSKFDAQCGYMTEYHAYLYELNNIGTIFNLSPDEVKFVECRCEYFYYSLDAEHRALVDDGIYFPPKK